jgi:RNA polymerase sigma-70 factor, ECF subfamily
VGGHHPGRAGGVHRDPPDRRRPGAELTDRVEATLRTSWWSAVAALTRLTGDLGRAEDAVQEACAAALVRWRRDGVPATPTGWLIGVARHKAIDAMRREGRRAEKEAAAMRDLGASTPAEAGGEDDELSLIFLCCHPALDPAVRVGLTLRAVCGLTTPEVAGAFLVPEPTMAKRLTRAKAKIRDAAIPFRSPDETERGRRLPAVLKVVYLAFTQGHMATRGDDLVRGSLCDTAVALARRLHRLLPGEPEVAGLLALLLLTDARRAARTDERGDLVLLEDQDRSRWDGSLIAEGEALLERTLRRGRPGPYQLQAAIAACHSGAPSAKATDWRQIALLYDELLRLEPSPVHEANRAVAVAMSEGPAAGLVILDALGHDPQLARWPQLHIARADLLRRSGRPEEAYEAYGRALQLEPPAAERRFIEARRAQLGIR